MKVSELIKALQDLPKELSEAEVMYSNSSFKLEYREEALPVDEINVSEKGVVFLDYLELGDENGEVIGEHKFVNV